MLLELSIRNFAVIPSLTVSFDTGMNVLTGETGAGKSIIIDAVSLLIGGRASTDYVRHGQDKAEIEGLFDVANHLHIPAMLAEQGIELDDETVILSRDISKQGKNTCRINGKLVTLSTLKEIGQFLVDIHGQHEHQSLLREEKHMALLDAYGKKQIEAHKQRFDQLFSECKQIDKQIKQLTDNEQQTAQRLDLLRFQWNEITQAQLQPGEDEQLEADKIKLAHAQKLYEGIQHAYEALDGEHRASENLAVSKMELEDLVDIDATLEPALEKVRDVYYQLEDVTQTLRDYRENIEFDSNRLVEIEDRLAELSQLKRKYGYTVDDILQYFAQIEAEIDSVENKEERIQEWINKREHLFVELIAQQKKVTETRTDIARRLVQAIKKELKGLYMEQSDVDIRMSPLTKGYALEHQGETHYLNRDGGDDISFLIAPNPGEPLKSLAKTASGGELSRFMLSLKTVFAKIEPVTTLIFDEVDTGVSGRIAGAMAERLYTISSTQQVLCITHQPQVAALSDHHFLIEKEVKNDKTMTRIVPLSKEQKENEIARMMSGSKITQTTEDHASELIQQAQVTKSNISAHI